MSISLSTVSTIFNYLAECGDSTIWMKMNASPDYLTVTFDAYEKRSFISRMLGGLLTGDEKHGPWSILSSTSDGSFQQADRKPVKNLKADRFKTIIVRFSTSARDAYRELVSIYHKDPENVEQNSLINYLKSVLCHPNVTKFQIKMDIKNIEDKTDFYGRFDRLAPDDCYNTPTMYFYTDYVNEIRIN